VKFFGATWYTPTTSSLHGAYSILSSRGQGNIYFTAIQDSVIFFVLSEFDIYQVLVLHYYYCTAPAPVVFAADRKIKDLFSYRKLFPKTFLFNFYSKLKVAS